MAKIQEIIDLLESQTSKDKATFGIFQYGGGPDESFIRADKEGLKLFAIELLKASVKSDEILNDGEKNIIPITFEEDWIDEQNDINIHYVEPVHHRHSFPLDIKPKSSLLNKLTPFLAFSVFLLIIIAIIVGFATMFSWVF